MNIMDKLWQRHLTLMHDSAETLGHILKNTTQEQATTLRDGPEGWTILEVVCHLRDADIIFRQRAEMMLAEDNPELPAFDHASLVTEKAYNDGELAYAYDEFQASREQTRALFSSITPEQRERPGQHPHKPGFTLTHAVMQVGHHDINHIEQITRILEQEEPGSGALPSERLHG